MKKLVMALSVVGLLTGPAFILSGPALAHEPGTYESAIVEQRVKRFKQSGADIQSVFKQHIPSKNFGAIEAAAMRIAIWASQMPDAFPEGSTSVGARDTLWENFSDFKAKAEANETAARNLKAAVGSQDMQQIVAAAKKVGATCKSCHEAYRLKH